MVKTAWDLKRNEKGIVKGLTECELMPALAELGLVPGAKIMLIRRTVFGGPVYLRVNDNFLAMRKNEAKLILLEDN